MSQREGKRTGMYRSKLEQPWAMFLVEHGIPFVYEPKRYGNWLPDFELTDCRALIEVKPTGGVSQEELPKYYEGMKLAYYNEKRDIVVLIGQPMFDDGNIHNVLYFIDGTCATTPNSFDEALSYPARYTYLVRCKKCEAYFFISSSDGSRGQHRKCRKCGYYDGDRGFECSCLDWENWERLNPWVKKWFDPDWNKPQKGIKSPAGLAFYLATQEVAQGVEEYGETDKPQSGSEAD